LEKPRLGFIGLGVMGTPMASHLLAAGYDLTVYDINESAAGRLRARYAGVSVADSAREVARASEVVITMLPSGREVRDAVFGEAGLLSGFKRGDLLLDTSSSEPWFTEEVAGGLTAAGVEMVDAPVSGAEIGAIAAELVFMVGGAAESVRRVAPILEVLGKKYFHVGPVGAGHTMKSVNNLITAETFMATAEGLIIGRSCGLDPVVMNEVLNECTGMSWVSQNHIPQRVLTRSFDDPFKLELMVKDVNIALRIANDRHLKLPLSESACALWREIQTEVPRGGSVSELVRVLEDKTGVELSSPALVAGGSNAKK
jgi:3-hydroxyisobutyrate dehydrogenase